MFLTIAISSSFSWSAISLLNRPSGSSLAREDIGTEPELLIRVELELKLRDARKLLFLGKVYFVSELESSSVKTFERRCLLTLLVSAADTDANFLSVAMSVFERLESSSVSAAPDFRLLSKPVDVCR